MSYSTQKACRVCSKIGDDCPSCLQRLFGQTTAPTIDLELAKFHTFALSTIGRTSLPGVQKKISADFGSDRATLKAALGEGRFIIKPRSDTFPQLPENEFLTMTLANAFGIDVPPFGLFPLRDGTLAYITRRFDRIDGGGKFAAEDFCQLAMQSPKEKYAGSAERCAKLVRRYCDEPGIEVLKLFRMFLFSYWVGNGDLHLKNLAILTGSDTRTRLAPAYDVLATQLLIPDDPLALTVDGKRKHITRRNWLAFADSAQIPHKAAIRILRTPQARLQGAIELISRATLHEELKQIYLESLRERSEVVV